MKRFMITLSAVALTMAVSGSAMAGGKGQGGGGQGQGPKTTATNSLVKSGQLQVGNKTVLSQNLGSADLSNKKINTLPNGSGPKLAKKLDVQSDQKNKGKNQMVQHDLKKSCNFKDYTGHCYKGINFHFWSQCYFDSNYGCEVYYCPTRLCWYFWFEPWDCYLPCDYFVQVYEF